MSDNVLGGMVLGFIFILIFLGGWIYNRNKKESRCPKCKKEEDIKVCCRHCGYEYKIANGGDGGFDSTSGAVASM